MRTITIKSIYDYFFNDDKFRDISRGFSTSFIIKVGSLIIVFVMNYLMAKLYGSHTVGKYSIFMSVLTIAVMFGVMGSNTAVLRLVPEYSVDGIQGRTLIYKRIFILVLLFSTTTSIVLFGLSDVIASKIFKKEYMSIYIKLVSITIIPFAILTINFEFLRSLKRIKESSLLQMIYPNILLLMFMVLSFFYFKIDPVYIYVGSIFITLLISFHHIKESVDLKSGIENKNVTSKMILQISFPMFITSLMRTILLSIDILLLGVFATESEVGVYSIVVKLAMLTTIFLAAVNSSLAPKISELYFSGKEMELKQIAIKSSKLIFWLALPTVVIMGVFGEFILGLFGEEFKKGYFALILLLIGQFINSATGSVEYFLNMVGYEKIYRRIIIYSSVLNVFLNLLFIPKYGIIGAGFSTMVSLSLSNIITAIYIKRKFGYLISYIPFIKR